LIYNYDLSAPPRNNKFDDYSCEQLCEYIEKNDKTVLEKIDCKNKRRLIRAAQIIDSGNQLHVKNKPLYNPIIIETSLPSKEELYDTINKNVDKMFNSGWKQEVIDLYKKDNDIGKLNAFKAIGYPEILNSIINNTNVDIDKIKQKTRQYAKRQLTWIKYHYSAHPIYNQKNLNEIFDYITSKL
jgi:tRNA dimethylallyltransferase